MAMSNRVRSLSCSLRAFVCIWLAFVSCLAVAREDPRPNRVLIGNMSRVPYDAYVAAGANAIIQAGFGNGSVPDYLDAVLKEVRAKRVLNVRATRTGSGAVVRNGETNDDANDYIVVDDQNPAKAHLLMAPALTKASNTGELQKKFWKYQWLDV
jgi:L-asparaginase/Glu-tRNA(Gln) amidotransferase subunit D